MQTFIKMLKTSVENFLDDDCMSSGAAIAYYTIFSLPPLLVIALMVASSLGYTKEHVDRIVHQELGLPATSALTVGPSESVPQDAKPEAEPSRSRSFFPNISAKLPASFHLGNLGIASKIVGLVILIASATGIFGQLQFSLNRVWEVAPDPEQGGFRSFFLKRLLTAGMVIAIGFVLLVSLILTTTIDQILIWINGRVPGLSEQVFGLILNEAAGFVVASILFAAMFKLLPDAKLRWKDVWFGAAATAFLFVTGKAVIGWYLRTSQVGSTWGASAVSTVAALVWVYYSSLIVLFGAELTQAWVSLNGGECQPAEGAVRAVKEKRLIRD